MAGFISQVIQQLAIADPADLRNVCFVFPTRRACHYLRHILPRFYPGKSFIAPEILTIEDFVVKHSGMIIPDELHLLLTLHDVFNRRQPQPFEEFYAWGKMVLRDFVETDKYLVDARKLFTVLKEHREMEENWGLDEEALKEVRHFWDNVNDKGETPQKHDFIQTWRVLGEIYEEFNAELNAAGLGHMGMAYRKLVKMLGEEKLNPGYDTLVFAGFNALSRAEEKIFSACLERGNTHLIWDADKYYFENPDQEAGNFLRHYHGLFEHPNSHWIIEDRLSQHKGIFLHGTPGLAGQAQSAARLLGSIPANKNTAVILCDEHLLMPLLYAVDPREEGINITMGYPVRLCIPYQLVELVYHLFAHTRTFSGEPVFYYKHLSALLNHTYVQSLLGAQMCREISEAIQKYNRVWVGVTWMKKHVTGDLKSFSATFLPLPQNGIEYGRKLEQLFSNLLIHDLPPLDRHVCKHLLDAIALFNGILDRHRIDPGLMPYYKLLRQNLHASTVPFEGSSIDALQVMGFLESRMLDFDELIILSANDQNLPAPNRHRSFIPYHLRAGFGMPTFEEQDAIYAYHFYRLIQRSQNVHIYYNTSGSKNENEPSRFILQLGLEHPSLAGKIDSPNQALLHSWKQRWPDARISIPKTPEILEYLHKRNFSASSLLTYLRCPVQFYLHYIARIDEQQEITETVDNLIMGKVLHKTMEILYKPWVDIECGTEDIAEMNKPENIEAKLQQAFVEEMQESSLQLTEGKNYLIFEVLKDIVTQFLAWDAEHAPFTILGLEEKVVLDNLHLSGGRKVSIEGRLDRRDRINRNGEIIDRVIDYKTGLINIAKRTHRKAVLSAEAYAAQYFKPNMSYKEGFQGYVYALLLKETLMAPHSLQTGFYSARKFADGVSYVNEGKPVPGDVLDAFKAQTIALIEEIFDPDKPFIQSDDIHAYDYSPFAGLVPL